MKKIVFNWKKLTNKKSPIIEDNKVMIVGSKKLITFLKKKEAEKRERNIEFSKRFRFDINKLIEVKRK